MPYIKMGKIEIVGFVLGTSQDGKFYEYQGNMNNVNMRIDLFKNYVS